MPTTEDIYAELKQVYDPEIPVNIVDLGLVYEVEVEESIAKIKMTLTSQACPMARQIPEMMKQRLNTLPDLDETRIEIVWEPQWGPQMISPEGRKILGIEDDAVR